MNALALLLLTLPTQATAESPASTETTEFDAGAAADAMIESLRPQLENPKKIMRLHVTFVVPEEHEQQFLDLFKMATLKTRTEPGNITYFMSKVAGEETPTYILFETWKSLDALDEHMHTDYLAEVLETLPEITESVDLKVMTPVLTKEHRKPSMKKMKK